MFYLVKILATLGAFLLVAKAQSHEHASKHSQQSPFAPEKVHSTLSGPTWAEKYGTQFDQSFSGPLSFSHLPYFRCLENEAVSFDIAVIGLPFDTAVTYRPGYLYPIRRPTGKAHCIFFFWFRARFGPFAIRSGSRRQREARGYTLSWANNPFELGHKIIDCGDVRFIGLLTLTCPNS
jgi:agmatinase